MKMFALGLALLSLGSGALAADPPADEPTKEKKICRIDKMTGSLTRRTRTCMTEAQWRALNDNTRKGLEEMGQSASGGTNSSYQAQNGPGGPGN